MFILDIGKPVLLTRGLWFSFTLQVKFEPKNAGSFLVKLQVVSVPVVKDFQPGGQDLESLQCTLSLEVQAEEPKVEVGSLFRLCYCTHSTYALSAHEVDRVPCRSIEQTAILLSALLFLCLVYMKQIENTSRQELIQSIQSQKPQSEFISGIQLESMQFWGSYRLQNFF